MNVRLKTNKKCVHRFNNVMDNFVCDSRFAMEQQTNLFDREKLRLKINWINKRLEIEL